MTTPAFSVHPTSRYERLSIRLQKAHGDFEATGEGQYRLSLGRWRFRYDIAGQVVELHYCGLRREDTY